MHDAWCLGHANCFAQKSRLLRNALDQMDLGAWDISQRASEDDAGKTTAAAEIDPDPGIGFQVEQLERVCDMPGPELRLSRGRNQIGLGLPFAEQCDVAIEPRFRFS